MFARRFLNTRFVKKTAILAGGVGVAVVAHSYADVARADEKPMFVINGRSGVVRVWWRQRGKIKVF